MNKPIITNNREENIILWICLSQIRGINNQILSNLMETFNQPQELINLHREDLIMMGLKNNTIHDIKQELFTEQIKKELKHFYELGGNVISILDPEYPINLKQSMHRIPIIYYYGTFKKEDQHSLAIVGTRRCSQYGNTATKQIIEGFVSSKITIVSGMAMGIDRISHQACINNGIRTIAVLGQGLLSVTNKQSQQIIKKISQNGVVLSQFPLNSIAQKYTFPLRNATISGLSKATAIIESNEKGGALITAEYAKKENKIIFALPGMINSLRSKGTNKLLLDGAIPLLSANIVIKKLFIPTIKTKREKNLLLSREEQTILDTLQYEVLHIDKLLEKNDITLPKVLAILSSLELKSLIEILPGKYIRKITLL